MVPRRASKMHESRAAVQSWCSSSTDFSQHEVVSLELDGLQTTEGCTNTRAISFILLFSTDVSGLITKTSHFPDDVDTPLKA